MDLISEIDTALFYFINVNLQNPFSDWFMPFITEKYHWFPVWGVAIIGLIWKGGKKGRLVVLLIIPVIFLSDQISAHVLKPIFSRPRPCVTLPDVHLLVGMKRSLSLMHHYFHRKGTTATAALWPRPFTGAGGDLLCLG